MSGEDGTMPTLDELQERIAEEGVRYCASRDALALLCLVQAARVARLEYPTAAFIAVDWSDQIADELVGVTILRADGLEEVEGEAEPSDLLTDECSIGALNESTRHVWEPYVKSDDDGRNMSIDIDKVLTIDLETT